MEILAGVIGVIVGALLQFFYAYRAEKRLLKNDYKKMCITEWFTLIAQVSELVSDPKDYNHIIFAQYLEQKIELIRYVEKGKKVEMLVTELNAEKDAFSLNDYTEKALNIKNETDENKRRLMRDITILVNKVVREVYQL